MRITLVPVSCFSCLDEFENLRLDRDVKCRCWLIGNQQFRLARQRHRDHHALSHAAGELVWVIVSARARVRNADCFEHLDGMFVGLLLLCDRDGAQSSPSIVSRSS